MKRSLLCLALILGSATQASCLIEDAFENGGGSASDTDATPVGGAANTGFDIRETDSVYAYRADSPYADVLKDCVLIDDDFEASCKLTTLPFIGDGKHQPTIDDVMDRVLVTHEWMGQRFEEVLRSAPSEVMTMFSSTTAVLMGSNVRPSFYQATHGAIQLDPSYLWTTVEEKSSISTDDDFRSSFGEDLQFWFLGSLYNRNGSGLTTSYSLYDDSERPVEDIKLPTIRLLLHELTHATDFMPRSEIPGLNPNFSVYEAVISTYDSWLSRQLSNGYPLNSEEMAEFAYVRYTTDGNEQGASNEQKASTAADVGALMELDGALQFYSYTTIREDFAQLVEGVAMSYLYDAVTNIGFVQKPANEEQYSCDDLLVSWGRRNRLADPLVNVRAREAYDLALSLTPEVTSFLDNSLGSPEAMQQSVSWCDNLALSTSIAAEVFTRSANKKSLPVEGPLFRQMVQEARLGSHHASRRGLLTQ